MSDFNEKPISVSEMLGSFDIAESKVQTTGFTRYVRLSDTNLGIEYTGRLHWNADDGYTMVWDKDAPVEADRPEFEYVLDSILEGRIVGSEWLEAAMVSTGRKPNE